MTDISVPSDTSNPPPSLRNKALGLLARREHSRKELHSKLVAAASSHPELIGTIPDVLDRLSEQGLLSDERFTEAYINMRARKGCGPLRISVELADKGIEESLARQYLTERDDWDELLRQAWQKKYGRAPADYAEKAKQMRFLQYKGFAIEQIKNLLD